MISKLALEAFGLAVAAKVRERKISAPSADTARGSLAVDGGYHSPVRELSPLTVIEATKLGSFCELLVGGIPGKYCPALP